MYTKHPKDADWSKIQGVLVLFRDREVREYASLKEAVIDVGYVTIKDLNDRDFIQTWVERTWVPRYYFTNGQSGGGYYRGGYWGSGNACIFTTTEGIRIPVWKLQEAALNFCPWKQKYYRYYWQRKFKFRDGPVEGIRCWKAGRYHGYRWIKTHQERRETAFHEKYDEDCKEYGVKIRGRRKHKSIPTRWDDIRNYSYYKKSWKDYRGHQWKVKE